MKFTNAFLYPVDVHVFPIRFQYVIVKSDKSQWGKI